MIPFHDPTLTDITQIPATLGGLKVLSTMISLSLVMLLVPLEAIHQNIDAIEGKNEFTNMYIRLGLYFVGMILYEKIFSFIVQLATTIEYSILSEAKWSDLLSQLAVFFKEQKVSLLSTMPMIFSWLLSFLALLIKTVLYWVRFCLLSVLYFVGPICFAFLLYKPTSHIPRSWFKNVIQLSLWTVVLKIIVRVMLELQVVTILTGANRDLDILTLSAINTTFVMLLILSPFFTAKFINGDNVGAIATLATTMIVSKGWSAAKGTRMVVPDTARRLQSSTKKIMNLSRTILRDHIFNRKKEPS